MKRLTTYIIIFIAVIILAQFLPFQVIDFYDGDWMDQGNFIRTEYNSGFSFTEAIFILGMIPFVVLLAIRNRIWINILALIANSIFILYHFIVAFNLNFNLTANEYKAGLGWYLSLLAFVSLFVFLIINLVRLVKQQKENRKKDFSQDILDNF